MQTSPLVAIANRLACLPVADMDLHGLLTELCVEVRSGLDVEAVVFMTVEPPSAVGSDATAQRMADLQCEVWGGPVFEAVASGRAVYTPDLGRVAPVDLAMAAKEFDLTNSVALPLQYRGRTLGAVQLLESHERALGGWQVGALRPLIDVLSARLVDLRLMSRLRSLEPARPMLAPARDPEVTTAIPVWRRPEEPADRSSARHSLPSLHARNGRPNNGAVAEPRVP